jgi:protein involved in polysaccharide export with SLBB domain
LTQEQVDAARSKISQPVGVDMKVNRMRTMTASTENQGRDSLVKRNVATSVKRTVKKSIFGHDLFTNKQLTFEPNLNIATPTNYLLGPGDELIIDIWGDSQMTINEIISPEGKVSIAGVGLVSVSGLTIDEATQRLRRQLAVIYEGLRSGTVQMKVSLGSIRSILVNIAGEVGTAGTYTLPSLATLFHALHVAGGVNELGSLRSIKLYRSGKLFSEVDVYDYILNGEMGQDISLREGDLIVVPTYEKLIEVQGEVKRPMYYELKGEESAADVVKFVGGFTNDANRNLLSVTRSQDGGEYRDFSIESKDFSSFVMADGDVVFVAGNIDRYKNRVEVQGAVYREGHYAIDDKVKTVKQLIERAGGLRNDAFKARAILYREKPDWSMEVEAIDLGALMDGTTADIELRTNDMLVISSISDMQEEYTVRIFGSVKNPNTYPYADNMTVEDVVVAAGGLLESAATANVTITRRIKNPKSVQVSEQLFEIFTIELSDGLAVGDKKGFELKPFDQIYVRRSPVYVTQGSVKVKG